MWPCRVAKDRSCRNRCGHTRAMRGRPGPGALNGLIVGVVLVGVVLWLPAALAGDFYEFSDPLVFMGLPMITISAAVGALIGVPVGPVSGDGPAGQARRASWAERAVVVVVAVAAVLVALWVFLTATGSI
jgi:hypothetical protein